MLCGLGDHQSLMILMRRAIPDRCQRIVLFCSCPSWGKRLAGASTITASGLIHAAAVRAVVPAASRCYYRPLSCCCSFGNALRGRPISGCTTPLPRAYLLGEGLGWAIGGWGCEADVSHGSFDRCVSAHRMTEDATSRNASQHHEEIKPLNRYDLSFFAAFPTPRASGDLSARDAFASSS